MLIPGRYSLAGITWLKNKTELKAVFAAAGELEMKRW